MRDAMKSIIAGKAILTALILALSLAWSPLYAEEGPPPGDETETTTPDLRVALTGANPACGEVKTLGDIFCTFQESTLSPVILLIFGASFIGGVFLFWRGLAKLIEVADSKGQTTLSMALLPLASGSFLVALPAVIIVGIGSIFGGTTAWNFDRRTSVGSGSVKGDDFLAMVGNFAVNAAGPLATLVMGVAVVIGIVLVASSMFGLAKMSNPNAQSEKFSAIATKFFIGVCLINIFAIMQAISSSFGIDGRGILVGGSDFIDITNSALKYQTAANEAKTVDDRFKNVVNLAFMALIPFGLIAFVRGLLILKDSTSGSQQPNVGGGFTHILGGIALINAEVVSCAVMKTLAGGAAFCLTGG
jgi:hypothetical protein